MTEFPRNKKKVLLLVSFAYLGLGVTGIIFIIQGGREFNGGADTLTSVLAILGVIFSLMKATLLSECKGAALQYIGKKAARHGVSLDELNRMDIALRGPFAKACCISKYGTLYRFFLPILGTLMSATFKKSFTNGMGPTTFTITSPDAGFIDPTNVSSRIRGTSWAGAILYNTTSSITSRTGVNQTSWTYMGANASDQSGEEALQYYMPSLPQLVVAGSAGYSGYSTEPAPALSATIQCYSGLTQVTGPSGGIDNGNHQITVAAQENGTALLQVVSVNAAWACTGGLSDASGSVSFVSDRSGNWNTSKFSMESSYPLSWTTTPARLDMQSDIISDALGTAASYSGWDWNTDDASNPAYNEMLLVTRLSFAAAVLSFSQTRASSGPVSPSGTATGEEEKVILLANWALYITTILLLLQSIIGFPHIRCPGTFRVDFGILQIMEMRQEAVQHPTTDWGVTLHGHCPGYRIKFVNSNRVVAIRQRVSRRGAMPGSQHLGLVWLGAHDRYDTDDINHEWRFRIRENANFQ